MYQCKRGLLVVLISEYALSLSGNWYLTTGSPHRFRPLPVTIDAGLHGVRDVELVP